MRLGTWIASVVTCGLVVEEFLLIGYLAARTAERLHPAVVVNPSGRR